MSTPKALEAPAVDMSAETLLSYAEIADRIAELLKGELYEYAYAHDCEEIAKRLRTLASQPAEPEGMETNANLRALAETSDGWRTWAFRLSDEVKAERARAKKAEAENARLKSENRRLIEANGRAATMIVEADARAEKATTIERERIAAALDHEASVTPCSDDALVVANCARLVRADFSYDDADRIDVRSSIKQPVGDAEVEKACRALEAEGFDTEAVLLRRQARQIEEMRGRASTVRYIAETAVALAPERGVGKKDMLGALQDIVAEIDRLDRAALSADQAGASE